MNTVSTQTSTLRTDLVKYLRAHAHVENDFDETAAIRDVYAAPRLTSPQAELLTKLHRQSRYNNEFNEEWAFKQVLKLPDITPVQCRLLETIAVAARYDNDDNDFDSNRGAFLVMSNPGLNESQERVLSDLARNARYNNDFDEDWAFQAVTRIPIDSAKADELCDIFHQAAYDNGLNDTEIFRLALVS